MATVFFIISTLRTRVADILETVEKKVRGEEKKTDVPARRQRSCTAGPQRVSIHMFQSYKSFIEWRWHLNQQCMCSLMIAFFVVTGCASMNNRAKCAATGAAMGAAMGATAGGIIGHNNSGAHVRTEGAIVGGVIGALVGGTAGFLICKDEEKIAEPVPQPAPPKPVAQPAPPPVTQKIVLNSIQFDFDKSTIKPEFYPMLDAATNALKQQPATTVEIQGYTDGIGTEEYNQALSMRRAEAVKAYLVRQGIAREKLRVNGFGEDKPVANNTTAEGRRMNRRVEFIIN